MGVGYICSGWLKVVAALTTVRLSKSGLQDRKSSVCSFFAASFSFCATYTKHPNITKQENVTNDTNITNMVDMDLCRPIGPAFTQGSQMISGIPCWTVPIPWRGKMKLPNSRRGEEEGLRVLIRLTPDHSGSQSLPQLFSRWAWWDNRRNCSKNSFTGRTRKYACNGVKTHQANAILQWVIGSSCSCLGHDQCILVSRCLIVSLGLASQAEVKRQSSLQLNHCVRFSRQAVASFSCSKMSDFSLLHCDLVWCNWEQEVVEGTGQL